MKRFGGHLGTGWTCRAQVRDSGTRAGSIDTWFTSPTGQVYRSKIAAARGLGLDPSRSKSAQPEPRKEKPLEDITPDNQRVLRRKDTLLKSKSKKSTKTDVKGVVENVLKGQGGNVVPQVVNLSLNEMGELLMSMANAVDLEDCYDGLLFYKEEQMRYEAKLANRRYYEEILAEQLSMQQMAKEELDGYIDGDEKLLDVEQGVPAVGPHQVPDDNGASDSQYSEQQRLFDGHSPKVQRPSESDGAEQGEEETNMIKLDDGRLVRRSARNNSSSKSKTWGEDMHGAKTGFQDVVEAMEALEAMDNEGELQPPGPPCFDGWETEVELIRKCLVRVPARLGRPAAEDPPPLSPRTRDPCVIDALLSLSDGDGDGDADGDGDFINQDALAQSPQKCAPWVQKGFPIAQLSANGGHPTSLHPATLFYLRNLREQQEAEERAAAKWAKEKAERREAKKLEKMAVKEGSALGATPVSNHPSSDVASGKPSSRPTFGERLRGKSMQDIESALMERLRSYVSGLGGILPGGWTVKAAIRQHGANAGGIDAYYFDPAGIKYKSMIKVAESLGLNCANATKAKSVAAVLKSSGQRSHQKVDEKIAYQIAYTTGANPTIPDTDSTPVFPAADTLWQDTKNDPPAVHDAVVKETSSGIDTPGIRNTPGSIKDGNADGAPAPGAQRKRPRKSSTSSDKTKNKGANTDANNHGTENDKRTGDDSGQHHERKSSGNRIGVGNDNNHEDDDDDKKRRKIAASGPGAHKGMIYLSIIDIYNGIT